MNARTHTMTRLVLALTLCIAFARAGAQQLSNKPLINITGYTIDASVIPSVHELRAKTTVTFTALDALPVASFELHSGLKVSKVTNAARPLHCVSLPPTRSQKATLLRGPSSMKARSRTATALQSKD